MPKTDYLPIRNLAQRTALFPNPTNDWKKRYGRVEKNVKTPYRVFTLCFQAKLLSGWAYIMNPFMLSRSSLRCLKYGDVWKKLPISWKASSLVPVGSG